MNKKEGEGGSTKVDIINFSKVDRGKEGKTLINQKRINCLFFLLKTEKRTESCISSKIFEILSRLNGPSQGTKTRTEYSSKLEMS